MAPRPPSPARFTVPMLLGLLPLLFVPLAATAQAQPAPPSPADVLGWELGERFTDVPSIYRYFEVLADASPLVSVSEYGRSWEGRPLVQVLIASETHRARLEEILARNRELTDPSTSEARAAEIARTTPAVVYFSYGVHGNESSSSEAALWTAWDLARGAGAVAGVLDSAIVVVDPVVNPDGRARYVHFYRGARGMTPNPDPAAREHDEPWPGARTNHYFFDLNRDWTWLSQIETRHRLATWDRWNPQIHVDFHEMSPRSSYFFFPPAEPINPLYPEHTRRWAARIGAGNAEAFDREGWLYFTGESYDLFYPGYGDTWPSLLGSIGMTYEQAGGGSAGLAYERPDGTVLTLWDRAQHHRVAGRATLRTAAEGKTDLLLGFAEFHRNVDEGLPDILLVPGDGGEEPGRITALFDLLRAQGIRMEVANESFEASSATPHTGWEERREFPAGTIRVPARQPRGRLAATLLQAEVPLDATYSYDISAWSLPYGFGVEAHSVPEAPDVRWTAVEEYLTIAATGAVGRVGALLRPDFRAMPAVARFLAAGGRAVVLSDAFRVGGRDYPPGTLYLPRTLNDELEERVEAAGLAVLVEPASTGLTDEGPDLGTNSSDVVELPRIALVGGEGTSSGSFGAHWYFLEHRLGVPFDAVNEGDVGGLDLSEYDVLVLPEGTGFDAGVEERLVEWVRDGGTLVAVGSGARGIAGALGVEQRRGDPDEDEDEEDPVALALRGLEERQLARWESNTPGTILQVHLDGAHPLAAGAAADNLDERAFVLSTGASFEPSSGFETVAWFPEGLGRVSGVISDDTLGRLERSSWLIRRGMGSGSAILFADDPLFRMMWYSGMSFYANAVLLAGGG